MDLGWEFFLLSWITRLADWLMQKAPNGFPHVLRTLAGTEGRRGSVASLTGAATPGCSCIVVSESQTSYLEAQGSKGPDTMQFLHVFRDPASEVT